MSTRYGMCSAAFWKTPHSQLRMRGFRVGSFGPIFAVLRGIVLSALLAGLSSGAFSKPQARKVVCLRAASVDAELFRRVISHVDGELRSVPNVKEPQLALSNREHLGKFARQKLATDLGAKLGTNEIFLIAFIATKDAKPEDALYVAGKIALVDVAALRVSLPSTNVEETHARRVEKVTIAAIASLLNMKHCRFKRCATSSWKTNKELDVKGRGFCPPCHGKVLSLLKKQGVEIRESRMRKISKKPGE